IRDRGHAGAARLHHRGRSTADQSPPPAGRDTALLDTVGRAAAPRAADRIAPDAWLGRPLWLLRNLPERGAGRVPDVRHAERRLRPGAGRSSLRADARVPRRLRRDPRARQESAMRAWGWLAAA